MQKIAVTADANQVHPGVWVGSRPAPGVSLRAQGFTSLWVMDPAPVDPRDYDVPVVAFPFADGAQVPSGASALAARIARHVRAGGTALVTCYAGLNRSALIASLAVWYLTRGPGVDVLWQVQTAREGSLCNPFFASFLYHLPRR